MTFVRIISDGHFFRAVAVIVILRLVHLANGQDTYKLTIHVKGSFSLYADGAMVLRSEDNPDLQHADIPKQTKVIAIAAYYRGPNNYHQSWPPDAGGAIAITSPYIWTSLEAFDWRCMPSAVTINSPTWTQPSFDDVNQPGWFKARRTINDVLKGTFNFPGWQDGSYIWSEMPYKEDNPEYFYAYCRGKPNFKLSVQVDQGTFTLFADGEINFENQIADKTEEVTLPTTTKVVGIQATSGNQLGLGFSILGKWLWSRAPDGWLCFDAGEQTQKDWSTVSYFLDSRWKAPNKSMLLDTSRSAYQQLSGTWIWSQESLPQNKKTVFCRAELDAAYHFTIEVLNNFTLYLDEKFTLTRDPNFGLKQTFNASFTTRVIAVEMELKTFPDRLLLYELSLHHERLYWKCKQDQFSNSSWASPYFDDHMWATGNTFNKSLDISFDRDFSLSAGGKYYCRGYLSIPVMLTVDNAFKLYADGNLIDEGGAKDYLHTNTVNIWHKPAIPINTKVIAIEATNFRGPAAIGLVSSHLWTSLEDFNWRCVDTVQFDEEWTKELFDEKTWSSPYPARSDELYSPDLPGNRKSGRYIWTKHTHENQKIYCRASPEIDECLQEGICGVGKCVNTMESFYCECSESSNYFGEYCEVNTDVFDIYARAKENLTVYADGERIMEGGDSWKRTKISTDTRIIAIEATAGNLETLRGVGSGFAVASQYVWTGFVRFEWKCEDALFSDDFDWLKLDYDDSDWEGTSFTRTSIDSFPLGLNNTKDIHGSFVWMFPIMRYPKIHCRARLDFPVQIHVHHEFHLYTDGLMILHGTENKWYKINMKRRTRLVAVKATHNGEGGGIAIFGKYLWSTDSAMGWKCASEGVDEKFWMRLDYNDSSWPKAVKNTALNKSAIPDHSRHGIGWIWSDPTGSATTVYCRTWLDFKISVRVRDGAKLFVDGQELARESWWSTEVSAHKSLHSQGVLEIPYGAEVFAAHLLNYEGPAEFELDSDRFWTSQARFGWRCIEHASSSEQIYKSRWSQTGYDYSDWKGADIPSCYTEVTISRPSDYKEEMPIWSPQTHYGQNIFCRAFLHTTAYWGFLLMSHTGKGSPHVFDVTQANIYEDRFDKVCASRLNIPKCTTFVQGNARYDHQQLYKGKIVPAYFTITFNDYELFNGTAPLVDDIMSALAIFVRPNVTGENDVLRLEKMYLNEGYLPACQRFDEKVLGETDWCYYIMDVSRYTFLHAIYACFAINADLYKPTSIDLEVKLYKYLKKNYRELPSFWLSSREIIYNMWTWEGYPTIEETQKNFITYWNREDKQGADSIRFKYCTSIAQSNPKWWTTSCQKELPAFMCQFDVEASGMDNCMSKEKNSNGSNIFMFFEMNRCFRVEEMRGLRHYAYFVARQECVLKGGELLKITSREVQQKVEAYLKKQPGSRADEQIWIGLHKSDVQHVYWEDLFKQTDNKRVLQANADRALKSGRQSYDPAKSVWVESKSRTSEPGCMTIDQTMDGEEGQIVNSIEDCSSERPLICLAYDAAASSQIAHRMFPKSRLPFEDLYDFEYEKQKDPAMPSNLVLGDLENDSLSYADYYSYYSTEFYPSQPWYDLSTTEWPNYALQAYDETGSGDNKKDLGLSYFQVGFLGGLICTMTGLSLIALVVLLLTETRLCKRRQRLDLNDLEQSGGELNAQDTGHRGTQDRYSASAGRDQGAAVAT